MGRVDFDNIHQSKHTGEAAIRTAILDQMTPEFVQIMIDKSPMKRLGNVEEAAEMVMWLSSSACTFNSGAVFDLSGGRATY